MVLSLFLYLYGVSVISCFHSLPLPNERWERTMQFSLKNECAITANCPNCTLVVGPDSSTSHCNLYVTCRTRQTLFCLHIFAKTADFFGHPFDATLVPAFLLPSRTWGGRWDTSLKRIHLKVMWYHEEWDALGPVICGRPTIWSMRTFRSIF